MYAQTICMYIYIYTYVCIYIYIYICIHTYYMYILKYSRKGAAPAAAASFVQIRMHQAPPGRAQTRANGGGGHYIISCYVMSLCYIILYTSTLCCTIVDLMAQRSACSLMERWFDRLRTSARRCVVERGAVSAPGNYLYACHLR